MMHRFAFWIVTAHLASALAGCSRSPQITFYTLEPGVQSEVTAPTTAAPSVSVGPVTLPDMVDRPQLVVRVAATRMDILEAHRWAEPLKSEIPRLVAENLRRLLGSSRVSSHLQHTAVDADFSILIDIQRFEALPGKDVTIEAFWSLRRTTGGAPRTGRTLVSEPVDAIGYDPLVAAYSRALLAVSQDMARAVRKQVDPK